MSTDVTFFEETPFFSSSMEDYDSVQHILPIPSFSPMVLPFEASLDQEEHQPQSPIPSSNDSASSFFPHMTQRASSPLPAGSLDSSPPAPSASRMTDPSSSSHLNEQNFDWPIAIRKGIRSSRNPHPIYNFLSYHRLSPSYACFVSSLSSLTIPRNVHEALDHPGW